MNIEELREYALSKPSVTEGFPFGESTLVFKTNDKIFLIAPLDSEYLEFNAKCDPEHAIQLRERYPESIFPGYHMNKKHWNTVVANGRLSKKDLLQLVDESYNLVKKKK